MDKMHKIFIIFINIQKNSEYLNPLCILSVREQKRAAAVSQRLGKMLFGNYTMQPTVSGMMSLAPVLATTSSTVVSGAISRSTGPSGVMWITASSDTM